MRKPVYFAVLLCIQLFIGAFSVSSLSQSLTDDTSTLLSNAIDESDIINGSYSTLQQDLLLSNSSSWDSYIQSGELMSLSSSHFIVYADTAYAQALLEYNIPPQDRGQPRALSRRNRGSLFSSGLPYPLVPAF